MNSNSSYLIQMKTGLRIYAARVAYFLLPSFAGTPRTTEIADQLFKEGRFTAIGRRAAVNGCNRFGVIGIQFI